MEEMKKNFQLILDRLDTSQGVIEVKAFEVLNHTDKLANILKEEIEALNSITEQSSWEEMKQIVVGMKSHMPMLMECVSAANDASHDLEEHAEHQKETIDNIQCAVDYLFSCNSVIQK